MPLEREVVRSTLGARIGDGQQILIAASMVGDSDDFGVWSARCRRWTRDVGESLVSLYGEEGAATFQRATATANEPKPWQETLGCEAERIEQVLAMLTALSKELATAVGDFR
jgi:hypothetical protein